MSFRPFLNGLSDGGGWKKMRSSVTGFRSAELLPAATVVISLCFSDLKKKPRQCLFSRAFLHVGSEKRAVLQEQQAALEIEVWDCQGSRHRKKTSDGESWDNCKKTEQGSLWAQQQLDSAVILLSSLNLPDLTNNNKFAYVQVNLDFWH